MSHSRFVAPALFLSLLALSSALYYKDVTPDNFDQLIDSSKSSIMLEFYAPWCIHSLAPEYEQLGETFERSEDVIIAQVNADKHKDLAKRFSVGGFPTLKWIQKGTPVDDAIGVDAGGTGEDLLEYINEKTGLSKKLKEELSSVAMLTEDNFKAVALSKDSAALVGFFAPWCGHCKAVKPAWEELATLYADEKDVIIGEVDCDADGQLAEDFGVAGFPTIKFFGRDGAEVEDFKGARDIDSFVAFINEKTGLDIAVDGGVMPTGGLVEEITEHIKSFISASTEAERMQVMDTCQETVQKLDEKAQSNFKYYSKVFAKIAEKGVEYVSKEKERLSKMLEASASLKTSQKRSFMRRINVLRVFDEL